MPSRPRHKGARHLQIEPLEKRTLLAATVSIDDVTQLETDSGTTAFNFAVTLSEAVAQDVTVVVDTADIAGQAVAGTDYAPIAAQTVTFTAGGVLTQPVTVDVTGETVVEDNEQFEVNLTDAKFGGVTDLTQVTIADAQGIGLITNDDSATLTITPITETETDADFTVQATVTLDAEVEGGFDLGYSTALGTAEATDYTVAGTSLSFAGTAGEQQTIDVTIHGDNIVEANETFTITLGDVTGTTAEQDNTIATGAVSNGLITNDDSATLTITPITETETAADFTVQATVTLDAEVEGGFDLAYSTALGTAEATDYTVAGTSLSFAGTAAEQQTIDVTIHGDNIVEANETFTITLGDVTGTTAEQDNTIATGAVSNGLITNDDSATLTITPITETETDADFTVQATVTLDAEVEGGFDLGYSTALGTAEATDYTVAGTSLTFAGTAGEQQTIDVTIHGDNIVEANETFTITLGDVTGTTAEQDNTITTGAVSNGLITNDDSATLTITPITETETDADFTVQATVTLDAEVEGGFDLGYSTALGTAEATDYTVAGTSLSFAGTAAEQQTIDVTIHGDNIVEANETFTITLGDVTGTTAEQDNTITTGAVSNGLITNDDSATLTITPITETETAADFTVQATVTLDAEVEGGFQVAYSTALGTAEATDYTVAGTSLSFAGTAGEQQTIDVTIHGDNIVEANETFTITLGDVTGTTAEQDNTITTGAVSNGLITNDDSATLTITPITETETAADFTVQATVTLDAEVEGGFDLAYSTALGTAEATDYTVAGTSLSFAGTAGEQQTIDVTIHGDNIVEANETFTITLGDVTGTTAEQDNTITTGAVSNGLITNDDSATLTITPITETETDADFTVQATVTLDAEVEGGFDLGYSTALGTAEATDYTVAGTSLTFAGTAGEQQTIDVTIHGDNIVEANETFTITLGDVTGTTAEQDNTIATGAVSNGLITNDDSATLTITPITETETAADFTVQATVTLDAEVEGGFDLAYSTALGTAEATDYTVAGTSLSFAGTAGEQQTIDVTIHGDNIVEANETFTITLGDVTGTTAEQDNTIATGAVSNGLITNDDSATLTITPITETETDADFTVQATVTLDAEVEGGFDLGYSTALGTAEATDYTVAGTSLTFAGTAGEQQTIDVTIHGDNIVEDNETFTITLGDVTGTTAEQDNTITTGAVSNGLITNDDSATLTITPITETETDADFTVQATVTLDAEVEGGFDLAYSTALGTAEATDYTVAGTSLTFAGTAGEQQTIDVTIHGDNIVEANETFTITLGDVTGTTAEQDNTITTGAVSNGLITNDDSATLTITPITETETDADFTVQATVTLDAEVEGGFQVAYSTALGTAEATDYTVAGTSLSFAGTAGEQQTIDVTIHGDNIVEANETFTITLGDVTGTTAEQDNTITTGAVSNGLITNDDSATLTITPITETETAADFTVQATVTLDAEVEGGFQVAYGTALGTAEATDYTVAGTSLSFAGTAAEQQTIDVTIHGDNIVEANETFTITLGDVTGTTAEQDNTITTGAVSNGLITNDDSATLTITPITETETDADFTVQATVTLDAEVEGGFDLGYSTALGTAEATDYTVAGTSLSFAGTAGEQQTIDVTIHGDNIVEANETFTITLGDVTGTTAEQDNTIATGAVSNGLITNDDSATLTITPITETETAADFTVQATVTLDAEVEGGFDLAYSTALGTAEATDYTVAGTSLSFAGTAAEQQTIDVTIHGDNIVEDNETFTITLGDVTGTTAEQDNTIATGAVSNGLITNDDSATLTITPITETETDADFTVQATVTLDAEVEGGFDLGYSTALGTAEATDYTVAGTSLTFAGTAGEQQTIDVTIHGDNIVEANETFTITLGDVTGTTAEQDNTITTGAVSNGLITNDDRAEIEIIDVLGDEGPTGVESFVFEITISNPTEEDVTVDFSTADGSATVGDHDYTAVSGTVTFSAGGSLTETVSVSVVGDIFHEPDETFTLELTNPTFKGVTDLTRAWIKDDSGEGTIRNDDSKVAILITDVGELLIVDKTRTDDDNDLKIGSDGTDFIIGARRGTLGTMFVLPEYTPIPGASVNFDGIEARVPIGQVTGELVRFETLAGEDKVTVDFSDRNPVPAKGLDFAGGEPQVGAGDQLVLSEGSFDTATFNYESLHDGSIELDSDAPGVTPASTITYTGVEPILADVEAVRDVIFNLPVGPNSDVVLSDDGRIDDPDSANDAGRSALGGSILANTEFTNPDGSLTINMADGTAASDSDTVSVEGLDGAFDADLTVNHGGGVDTVNFRTNQTDIETGTFLVRAEVINVEAELATTGGDVNLAAEGNKATNLLTVNANVTSSAGDGHIWLSAGGSVVTNATARVSADQGHVLVAAGTDFNAGDEQNGYKDGSVSMGDGAVFQSTSGAVVILAPGDIGLSSVVTSGRVAIVADYEGIDAGPIDQSPTNDFRDGSGAIIDGFTSLVDPFAGKEAANVIASEVLLRAGNGIGDGAAADAGDLDLMVGLVAVETDSGEINLWNTGALEIGSLAALEIELPPDPAATSSEILTVGQLSGVTILDDVSIGGDTPDSMNDRITVVAIGPLAINQNVTNFDDGQITLGAGERNQPDDDLTVGKGVFVRAVRTSLPDVYGGGGITLQAGDTVELMPNSHVRAGSLVKLHIGHDTLQASPNPNEFNDDGSGEIPAGSGRLFDGAGFLAGEIVTDGRAVEVVGGSGDDILNVDLASADLPVGGVNFDAGDRAPTLLTAPPAAAWTLAGAPVAADELTLTVDDAALLVPQESVLQSGGVVDPPLLLVIDAERMLVTQIVGNVLTVERGVQGTTATDHPVRSLVTAFGNLLQVDDASLLLSDPAADTPLNVMLGAEELTVTSVDGNKLTVERGVNATAPVAHVTGAVVSPVKDRDALAIAGSDGQDIVCVNDLTGNVRWGQEGNHEIESFHYANLERLDFRTRGGDDEVTFVMGGGTGLQLLGGLDTGATDGIRDGLRILGTDGPDAVHVGTAAAWSLTGGPVDAAATALAVEDASLLVPRGSVFDSAGVVTPPFVVVVEAEKIRVSAVDLTTNILTVSRGVNGTNATDHADGAVVTLERELGSRFEIARVETLQAFPGKGDDTVINRTHVPSLIVGGDGNDILFGGDAKYNLGLAGPGDGPFEGDVIFGGDGVDKIKGNAGDDFLFPDHDFDNTRSIADDNPSLIELPGEVVFGGPGFDTIIAFGDFVNGGGAGVNFTDGGRLSVVDWLTADFPDPDLFSNTIDDGFLLPWTNVFKNCPAVAAGTNLPTGSEDASATKVGEEAAVEPATDLGTIDFRRLKRLDVSGEDLWYSFQTAHGGYLTVKATLARELDDLVVELYDANLALLSSSDRAGQTARLDYQTAANQSYSIKLSGTSANFDLRLANVLDHVGSEVSVHGTSGDDEFTFDASASRSIAVNGVEYVFPDREVEAVTFDGGEGQDTLILHDSEGDDSLVAGPDQITFSGDDGGFTVAATEMEIMLAYAKAGGDDTAVLASSGNFGKFKSDPEVGYAKMYGGPGYLRAKFFEVVDAYSQGGKGLARLFGSAGDDLFEGQKDLSRFSGDRFDVTVHDFGRVLAYSGGGNHDIARLVDSALEDELHAKPHKTKIFDAESDGGVYEVCARGFSEVFAEASHGGFDKAKLWDSARDDVLQSDDDQISLWQDRGDQELLYQVIGFEFVKARGVNGGSNTSRANHSSAVDLVMEGIWNQ